jgi:Flp pilus assembly protein TadG
MRRKQRQGGTTAIEFALVFPVLFFLLYSTVIYSLVYYVKQSLNFAAQEAARAAVAIDLGSLSAGAGSTVDLTSFVTPTVTSILNPITPAMGTATASASASKTTSQVTVTVQFSPSTLFNTVSLPGIGAIPPLPAAGSTFWRATVVGRM